ncbi:MAG: pyridoxal-phosphate dependent enzyme [bacterium]
MRALSVANISAAMAVIDPVFLDTPLLRNTSANRVLDAELFFKVETLTPIRSFKGRGTDNFVAGLHEKRPLVCASAGNFGQGLAHAARRRGLHVTVFAAERANPLKVAAMRSFGADVRLVGVDFDAAKRAAREHSIHSGALFVEDGATPEIAEGAGTMALEMTRAHVTPDVMLVPLGNGALATGIAAWMRDASPATRMIGIVADGAPAMQLSFEASRAISTSEANTIADGIAVRDPVPFAVACMRGLIDEVIAVPDGAIVRAMRFAHEHLGLVVEPAGVVGLAAALEHTPRWRGASIGIPLCGGNVTLDDARRWLCE